MPTLSRWFIKAGIVCFVFCPAFKADDGNPGDRPPLAADPLCPARLLSSADDGVG